MKILKIQPVRKKRCQFSDVVPKVAGRTRKIPWTNR